MHPFISDKDEANEAQRAALAIECHKIRVWLARHPGSTSYEIKAANGGRIDMCLAKMIGMHLVHVKQERTPEGRRINRWFVIPQ